MSFVQSITHLKNRPHADRALVLLQRVVSLVKPIMRKHNWHLPTLSEFFPTEDNLLGLNVNQGEKILLRLRPAFAPDTFYEEEQVVLVMLHELTHNVHGPHDNQFYSFLSKLEEEYYALKRSGYAGEGFFSKGTRLGGANIPTYAVKAKALEAAERRRQQDWIMNQANQLGGKRQSGKTPRELAAEAAERRIKDQTSCGSGVRAVEEAEKAAKESVTNRVIDLSGDDEEEGSSSSDWTNSDWTCTICTLINRPLTLQCSACLSERPASSVPNMPSPPAPPAQPRTTVPIPSRPKPPVVEEEWWTCKACGEEKMEAQFWMCRFCGHIKSEPVPFALTDI